MPTEPEDPIETDAQHEFRRRLRAEFPMMRMALEDITAKKIKDIIEAQNRQHNKLYEEVLPNLRAAINALSGMSERLQLIEAAVAVLAEDYGEETPPEVSRIIKPGE